MADGTQIRRRRECCDCNQRFTTFETIELNLPLVVKQSGERETFLENKLRSGVLRALEKRPIAADATDAMINRVLQTLRNLHEKEVSSRHIGELVMAELRQLDEVAFVRFASVYRSFQDIEEFRAEIEQLSQQVPANQPIGEFTTDIKSAVSGEPLP